MRSLLYGLILLIVPIGCSPPGDPVSGPPGKADGSSDEMPDAPSAATDWTAVAVPTVKDLIAISGDETGRLYIAAFQEAVLLSEDSGQSWLERPTSGFNSLLSIYGHGPRVITAGIYGEIDQSEDGGQSWRIHYQGTGSPSGTADNVRGLWGFGDQLFGGTTKDIVGSADGGQTWSLVARAPRALNGYWAASSSNLFGVGQGAILRSADGGRTWQAKESGVSASLVAVWANGSGQVYAVGAAGTIVHSADDGTSWTTQRQDVFAPNGLGEDLNAVWGGPSGDVFAVGRFGTLLRTTDEGQSWTRESSGTDQELWGVWGNTTGDVWVVGGASTLLHKRLAP